MTNIDLLNDLYERLRFRNQRVVLARNYVDGKYRIDHLSPKLREAFGQTLRIFGRNIAAHVVKVEADRLSVEGFDTAGDQELANGAWLAWRDSGMQALSRAAFAEAITTGVSYLSADPATGLVYIESSENTYVLVDPATRTRVAGLKVIEEPNPDPLGKVRLRAWLFTPDVIEEYLSDGLPTSLNAHRPVTANVEPKWTLVSSTENALGRVPICPLVNEPDARTREGTSGVLPIIEAIDYVHALLVAQAVSSELNAFPRVGLTGVEIPKDENNEPLPHVSLTSAQSRLWAFEPENARLWNLPAADLGNQGNAITDAIRLIASLSRTPQPALIMDLVNVSDRALVTSQGPFIAKVKSAQESFALGIAEAVSIALGTDQRIEPVWSPPAQWDPLMVAQAAQAEMAVNLPLEVIWARMGVDPRTVAMASERFRSLPSGDEPFGGNET
jgi:hypothetical protein